MCATTSPNVQLASDDWGCRKEMSCGSGEGVVLQQCGDIGRGEGGAEWGEWVVLQYVMIRKWSEVFGHWTMWHGCVDKTKVGGV